MEKIRSLVKGALPPSFVKIVRYLFAVVAISKVFKLLRLFVRGYRANRLAQKLPTVTYPTAHMGKYSVNPYGTLLSAVDPPFPLDHKTLRKIYSI
eukprot:snap_masked-scaffold_7-processed-gene-19.20-mRNA-1 protein AED:1.00 eAED:1.00 QI:0/-1/0/0/-1/1/1/0/94